MYYDDLSCLTFMQATPSTVANNIKKLIDVKLELEGKEYRVDMENATRVAKAMIEAVKRKRSRIKMLSKHIFIDSPFEKAIFSDANNNVAYCNIMTIRNYVAHESGEARSKYIRCCYGGDESKFKEPKPLPQKQEKRKWSFENIKNIRIDGGKALMAITNTLMLVQAGSPTGAWVACSR